MVGEGTESLLSGLSVRSGPGVTANTSSSAGDLRFREVEVMLRYLPRCSSSLSLRSESSV